MMCKMKKTAILVAICVLFTGFNSDSYAAERDFEYTILIYMNGSDLETLDYAATQDILEMIEADIPDNIAVIIQTGGTLEWHTDEYGLPSINAHAIQRWRVTDDSIQLVDSKNNQNMGSPSTLRDFVTYGVKRFPAEKYALFFWNHGAGSIYGFGADEHYNYDSLTVAEMNMALRDAYTQTETIFEIIGFDACLMASLEIAEMVDDYANYLVGSQELEPGHGWDYESLINTVANNNNIDSSQWGISIVDNYYEQAKDNYTVDTITLSVIDLTKVDTLVKTFEKLIEKVNLGMNNEDLMSTLIKIRLASESYGEGDITNPGSDMVDLTDYAERMVGLYENDAMNVIEAVQEAVIYNLNSQMKPNASGISVYMPASDMNALDYAVSTYNSMEFSNIYAAFIKKYSNILKSGWYESDDPSNSDDRENYLKDELEMSDIYGDDYNFYMNVDSEELSNNIDEVYSIMGFIDEAGDIAYLARDLVGYENISKDGMIIGDTLDHWVTIDDYFVPMYYEGYNDTGCLYYYIPIMLNGTDVDLLVIFTEKYKYGKIIGARPVYNSNVNYYDRELLQVNPGDEISIIYEYDSWNGDSYEYSDWYIYDTFILDDELSLEWQVLSDGEFAYSFELVDIYQNSYYTSWMIYDYYNSHYNDNTSVDNLWDAMNYQSYQTEDFDIDIYSMYAWLENYEDVPSDWALDYIDWAYYYDLTTENTLTGFTENITREEFCELVVNMYELSSGEIIQINNIKIFDDTSNIEILKAYELGIVNGYGDGTFRPNELITREQLIAMFYRALILLDGSFQNQDYDMLAFNDTHQISSWAKEPCEFMVYSDLIDGVGNNTLAPLNHATKEQALKLVTGVYEFYIYWEITKD